MLALVVNFVYKGARQSCLKHYKIMPDCFSKYFSDLFFNFVAHVALLFFKVGYENS